MPNYVSNIITVLGNESDARNLIGRITSEKGEFDFNHIIPMPQSLDIINSSTGTWGMQYLNGDKHALDGLDEKSREEALDFGQKYLDNVAKYGYPTWYEWRRAKWGTKWNACDCVVEGNRIKFDTAWNAPMPVYAALAKMFPANDFDIIFADEDMGANTGRITIVRGELDCDFPQDGSDEAYALYIETHPGADEYLYKDEETGEWKMRDE